LSVAGRPAVGLYGRVGALAPGTLHAHLRAAAPAEHRGHLLAVEEQGEAGEVVGGEQLAQPVGDGDPRLPRVIPLVVVGVVDVEDGDAGALEVGRVEDLHLGVGALAHGQVVAGVQLPAEGLAGAEDDGLGDAKAARGLLAVAGVAL